MRPRIVKHKGHSFVSNKRDFQRAVAFNGVVSFKCEVCGEKATARQAGANYIVVYRDWSPSSLRTCGDVVAEQVMKS